MTDTIKYVVGSLTRAQVFQPTDMADTSDMQVVLDAVETALANEGPWRLLADLPNGVRALVALRNDNTQKLKYAILYLDEFGFRVDDDDSQINEWNWTALCWKALVTADPVQPLPTIISGDRAMAIGYYSGAKERRAHALAEIEKYNAKDIWNDRDGEMSAAYHRTADSCLDRMQVLEGIFPGIKEACQ